MDGICHKRNRGTVNMKKHKKVFILWSGGLDSTYLVWKNLKDGNDVVLGYVNLSNNENKTVMEKAAIDKLLPKLKSMFSDYSRIHYLDTIVTIDVQANRNSQLPQFPAWLTSIVYSITSDIDEVQIGYVLNDDAIGWINDMKKLWQAYRPLMISFATLKFPLVKTSKEDILNSLPNILLEDIWFCENPGNSKKPCKTCGPCKRHFLTKGEFEIAKKELNLVSAVQCEIIPILDRLEHKIEIKSQFEYKESYV